MHNIFLSLGSNLGDRILNIRNTLEKINNNIGKIKNISKYYETEPWGFNTDNWFINIVIEIETNYSAEILLQKIQEIERKIGRRQKTIKSAYSSRIIDIDILFFENLILKNQNLQIPHKHLHKRLFVLKPLNDIASDFIHPIFNKTINVLLNKHNDNTKIKVIPYS